MYRQASPQDLREAFANAESAVLSRSVIIPETFQRRLAGVRLQARFGTCLQPPPIAGSLTPQEWESWQECMCLSQREAQRQFALLVDLFETPAEENSGNSSGVWDASQILALEKAVLRGTSFSAFRQESALRHMANLSANGSDTSSMSRSSFGSIDWAAPSPDGLVGLPPGSAFLPAFVRTGYAAGVGTATVPIAGPLWKQRDIFRSWRRRHFALVGGLLMYARREDDPTPHRVLHLALATITPITAVSVGEETCYGFYVSHPSLRWSFHLAADSRLQADLWIQGIQEAAAAAAAAVAQPPVSGAYGLMNHDTEHTDNLLENGGGLLSTLDALNGTVGGDLGVADGASRWILESEFSNSAGGLLHTSHADEVARCTPFHYLDRIEQTVARLVVSLVAPGQDDTNSAAMVAAATRPAGGFFANLLASNANAEAERQRLENYQRGLAPWDVLHSSLSGGSPQVKLFARPLYLSGKATPQLTGFSLLEECILATPMEDLVRILSTSDALLCLPSEGKKPLYGPDVLHIVKRRVIVGSLSDHTYFEHIEFAFADPKIVSHDAVTVVHWRKLHDGRVIIVSFSEDPSNSLVEAREGIHRCHIQLAGFMLTPTPSGVRIQHITEIDLREVPSSFRDVSLFQLPAIRRLAPQSKVSEEKFETTYAELKSVFSTYISGFENVNSPLYLLPDDKPPSEPLTVVLLLICTLVIILSGIFLRHPEIFLIVIEYGHWTINIISHLLHYVNQLFIFIVEQLTKY